MDALQNSNLNIDMSFLNDSTATVSSNPSYNKSKTVGRKSPVQNSTYLAPLFMESMNEKDTRAKYNLWKSPRLIIVDDKNKQTPSCTTPVEDEISSATCSTNKSNWWSQYRFAASENDSSRSLSPSSSEEDIMMKTATSSISSSSSPTSGDAAIVEYPTHDECGKAMCQHFLKGKCRFRDRCRKSHVLENCIYCKMVLPENRIAASAHLHHCWRITVKPSTLLTDKC